MRLSPGARLGPYEILSPLGAGGMGEVFRARDTRLGRDVAVKILPERLTDKAQALARFEREARAVAALSHPNILAIHDVGREDGVVFAVTELLEGESLDRRLARERLAWKKAFEIGAAVADGLASAHSRGIVHRDLKPANVFVTREGLVKILDFGLARHDPLTSEPSATALPTEAAPETEPGTVLGTVGYMAPEQVRGESADARSDIFALGCILYEMLSGRRAFQEKTQAETLAAILRDHPPELSESGKTMPSGAEGVVMRCLEKNPDERFQSARDLAFALRGIFTSSVSPTVPGQVVAPKSSFPFRGLGVATAILAALVAAFMLIRTGGSRTGLVGGTPRIGSLAVLPLANLSGDPQEDYFADGMTEQIIANLSRLKDLRVISRTSAMSYKGTRKRLPEIARELAVDAVVEGSVTRAGGRVKVSAELVQASNDRNLWADSYERDVRDVLALQGEIARAIARKISVELTPEDRARLESGRKIDPEAYEAYVKGRYYWNKRTETDLKNAIDQFQRALDRDPTYAPAYAGIADCYGQLGYGSFVSPEDSFPRSKAAAQKALELDPNLAEAHASLGFALMYYDWKFASAEAEFKRSSELNPNYAAAHQWYAYLLTAMERPEAEVKREIVIAKRLDPLSVPINTDEAYMLYYYGKTDDALRAVQKALEMNPKFLLGYFWLGRIYTSQGRFKEAEAALEKIGPLRT
ncbi:MAG TPA: protein kinase, partial [Thermoanaerobaculia bacterium]|nr:protein kinase [Thermoanaerobaculia bacterium]